MMITTTNPPIYTSRLIKASALLADTKVLLSQWDLDASVTQNLEQARSANIFGKASRKRVQDILTIFRQRYFEDTKVGRALVSLTQGHVPARWLDPLLYFYAVKNDRVLRDIVIQVLNPRFSSGYTDISIERVVRIMQEWSDSGKTTMPWGEETTIRVAQGAMATLRDFGVLQGKVHKSITPIYLPTESFAFLAFELRREKGSGERVMHAEEWKLFFLPVEGVERFFLEAHQERLLSYHAAGSLIRLEFQVNSLEELAHVLVDRTRQTS